MGSQQLRQSRRLWRQPSQNVRVCGHASCREEALGARVHPGQHHGVRRKRPGRLCEGVLEHRTARGERAVDRRGGGPAIPVAAEMIRAQGVDRDENQVPPLLAGRRGREDRRIAPDGERERPRIALRLLHAFKTKPYRAIGVASEVKVVVEPSPLVGIRAWLQPRPKKHRLAVVRDGGQGKGHSRQRRRPVRLVQPDPEPKACIARNEEWRCLVALLGPPRAAVDRYPRGAETRVEPDFHLDLAPRRGHRARQLARDRCFGVRRHVEERPDTQRRALQLLRTWASITARRPRSAGNCSRASRVEAELARTGRRSSPTTDVGTAIVAMYLQATGSARPRSASRLAAAASPRVRGRRSSRPWRRREARKMARCSEHASAAIVTTRAGGAYCDAKFGFARSFRDRTRACPQLARQRPASPSVSLHPDPVVTWLNLARRWFRDRAGANLSTVPGVIEFELSSRKRPQWKGERPSCIFQAAHRSQA